MNSFVGCNDPILNWAAFNITALFRQDDFLKDELEHDGEDFGDNFVDDITKNDRSKFVRRLWIILFGNESNKGRIEGLQNVT